MHDLYSLAMAVMVATLVRLWNAERVSAVVRAWPWVRRLPKRWQWVLPVMLGGIGNVLVALDHGATGSALATAALEGMGQIGLVAIGVWHTAKRLLPVLQTPDARARALKAWASWDSEEVQRELAAARIPK